MKELLKKIKNLAIKNLPILLAAVLVLFVAVVVVILLQANAAKNEKVEAETPASLESMQEAYVEEIVNVPLEENVDTAVEDLVKAYYQCLSDGDSAVLISLCDEVEDKELIRFEEQAKYLSYEVKEIYKQDGKVAGSSIIYVYCDVVFDEYPEVALPAYNGFYLKTRGDGSLYIVRGELTSDENEYISTIASQDDVVELNNRVTVAYNDIVVEHPEMLSYLNELDVLVNTAVGEKLAAMTAPEEVLPDPAETENQEGNQEAGDGQAAEDAGPKFATATTTVNVRKSDSENADKLGKVSAGTKLEVQEIQLNGWTRVSYEGQTGYIKSEFLSLIENAGGLTTIGKVTATSNVNVRILPNEDAERLGILSGGDTVDLFAEENGWCKIRYQGQVGYVKSEFVEKQ